ncbi:hypothetical protein GCM10010279_29550 [Streptomyces mutabilis]|nr:hypothetical protein GCM10010279_29550 [Streptomyces mutabilis]
MDDVVEADEPFLQLSGGRQQCVAIARALPCEVHPLRRYEPTGALGHETADGTIELYRRPAHDDGQCVIVVTHSRKVAAACDETLTSERGRLVQNLIARGVVVGADGAAGGDGGGRRVQQSVHVLRCADGSLLPGCAPGGPAAEPQGKGVPRQGEPGHDAADEQFRQ